MLLQYDKVKITESIYEMEICDLYNVFVPLISQATKCKIFISNFYYNESKVKQKGKDYLLNLANEVR